MIAIVIRLLHRLRKLTVIKCSEAIARGCFVKKLILKISSVKNNCARVYLQAQAQGFRPRKKLAPKVF